METQNITNKKQNRWDGISEKVLEESVKILIELALLATILGLWVMVEHFFMVILPSTLAGFALSKLIKGVL